MTHLSHRVWLAGAGGLVGRALLDELLSQPLYVEALMRRERQDLPPSDRLSQHCVDFGARDLAARLPAPDAVFICLGTTIKQAGSQQAFKAVDLDAVLNTARAARQAGARRCAVVSALGASPGSSVFYNRIKGEMESGLRELGFERLVIARPSLLLGDRAALGQPERAGERWASRLSGPFSGLIPKRWRPIEARTVARALRLAMAQPGPALSVLESGELLDLGSTT
ncbi:NAD(P)H-binding protein [Roseateles microcysteis]|uniref:NAD(P)H-binding protein n=1 Tax=Roseateles microcysteis TaxID=3119057 RepID=UPI002FE6BD21